MALPRRNAGDASVIVPTKDGARYIEEVLTAVFAQRGPLREVLLIDSGSRDGTLEIARRFPVRVHEIPPAAFNHGRTRNLGASLTDGTYIVFLTQDATPADDRWLERLLAPLEADPLVAGTCSALLPRPGCHPMEAREILEVSPGSGERAETRVHSAEADPEYSHAPWRQTVFWNTAGALRRAVWERYPLAEVDFAEDQEWAKRVLDAGFRTVIVGDSLVIHSHSYGPIRQLRRCIAHGRAMRELFGYVPVWSLRLVPRHVRESVRADWEFCSRRGIKGSRLAWAVRSAAWHTASVVGHWWGARSAGRPETRPRTGERS